jgi:hypothetical protein
VPNFFGELPVLSFGTITSISNCKAIHFHPIGGLFDPKNLALNLERTETLRIWDSFYSHFEFHIGADWRTNRRKDKSAMLADVTAAAFSPLRLPIPIRPPKRNRRPQGEADSSSGLALRIQESSPLNISKAHTK